MQEEVESSLPSLPLFRLDTSHRNTLNTTKDVQCWPELVSQVPSDSNGDDGIMGFKEMKEDRVNINSRASNNLPFRLQVIKLSSGSTKLEILHLQLRGSPVKLIHDTILYS